VFIFNVSKDVVYVCNELNDMTNKAFKANLSLSESEAIKILNTLNTQRKTIRESEV
jgi:hypothetical protein